MRLNLSLAVAGSICSWQSFSPPHSTFKPLILSTCFRHSPFLRLSSTPKSYRHIHSSQKNQRGQIETKIEDQRAHLSRMQPQSQSLLNCLFLLFCIVFCGNIHAQISIPPKLDGFWYRNQPLKTDSIYIEAFLDPVCPDSRDSWPPLKKAINYYGSRVSLLVHTFPLPYHDNAFACSRALHIVDKLNTSATYNLLEAFFEHQEMFYGKATSNLSRTAIEDKIVEFATQTVGNSFSSAIKIGFSDYRTDQATRISFKYGCVKGVYGTPIFFVNGFPLPGAGSAIDYNGWRRIIDPLIKKKGTQREQSLHFFL